MGIKLYKNSKSEEIGYTAQYKSKKMLKSKSKTFTGQGAKSRAREWLKEIKRGDRNGTLNDLTLQETMLERLQQIEGRGVFHTTENARKAYKNFLRNEKLLKVKMEDCSAGYLTLLLKNLKKEQPGREHFSNEMKFLRSTLFFYKQAYNARFFIEWTHSHTAYGIGCKKPVKAFKYSDVIDCINNVLKEMIADAYRIQFIYGLRKGMAFALRVEDIDYKDGLIHFNGTIIWQKRKRQDYPKTNEKEFVLVPEAREILMKYTSERKSGLVFSEDGIKPLVGSTTSSALKRVGITSHAIRKSVATATKVEKGLENSKELLGHDSTDITIKHYIDQQLANQLSQTPAWLAKLIMGKSAGNGIGGDVSK